MRINISASVFWVGVDVKLVLFYIELRLVDVDLIARRMTAEWRGFDTHFLGQLLFGRLARVHAMRMVPLLLASLVALASILSFLVLPVHALWHEPGEDVDYILLERQRAIKQRHHVRGFLSFHRITGHEVLKHLQGVPLHLAIDE